MGFKLQSWFRRRRSREEKSAAMVLTVTEDTPADMLAGSMELLVQLPRDHHVHSQRVTVERSTAMMDLLVQIATAHKLAASSYTLQAIGERGVVLPHQPNTPIGALDALQVKLLPKQGTFIPRKAKQPNQPFETTFRLQVHLPRNQLYVSRVSPKMNLGEILEEVCREKNLDRNKYELRHPGNHEEILDPSLSLQDYHLQEVTLYARQGRMLGSALSSQDIMALQRQEDRRRQQAKQSVFGFMFRKSKESSLSTDSLGRSVSPAHSDETARSVSPLAPPTRPQRKRRPAPSPPVQTTQNNNIEMSKNHKEKLIINHSRNSSDSSGYHEASVLSDNPDSAMMPETLPRRSKAPGKFEARRLAHTAHASKSLSNLAMTASLSHATSNSSLSSTGIRKKRAAPPPPISRPLSSAISTQALERIVDSEESLTSDMGISKPPSDIGTNSKANSDIAVGIHTPESPPEDFYQLKPSKKSVEMMTEGSQDRKSHVIEQIEHIVEPARVAKRDFEEVPSSTDILLQKVSTTLATVVPSSDAHDSPPTPPTEPSITSPEPSAPSSANQTLNSQQDTSDYVSATGEELSTTDWEYQLPDPPSAFRDTESPTFGYDTITLASVDAFKEPIALIDPAESSMDHRDPQSPLESPVAPTDHPKDLQQSPESHKKPEIPSLNCKESQIPLTSEDPKKSQLSGISENPTSRITMSPENPIKNQKSLITENPIKPETLPLSEKPIKLSPEVETSPVELKKHIITELESKIENGSLKFDDSKKIFNKSSPRIAPVDNTLSNFTITTYSNQKPSIWSETSDQIFPDASDERIVKTFATLSRNRSGFPKEAAHISKRDKGAIEESRVRRAQSFQDVERQEEGKLRDARESEKEALDVVLRPQKMNNDGKSSVVHRSKSYIVLSNNSKYREAKTLDIPDTPMYKSTSYTNLNQEREELQSLQVLKSILPQLKKSSLENTPEKSSEKFQPPPDSPKPHEKRYKWAGPPAISLGSWSERPSVNVQIKHDSDYKFGATPSKSNQSGGKTVVNLNSTSNDVEIINYENSRPTRSITHTKIGSKTESRTNFLEKLAAVEKSRIFETPKIDEIDKCIEKSSKSNDSDDVKIDRRPVNFRELTQAFGQVNFRSKSRPNQQSIQNRHSDYFEYRSESDNARQENYQNNWSKGKRYTSVVGINPHGVVQGNGFRNEPKVNGPKVNGFLPVVKGFKVQVKETVKSDNVGDRVPPPPPPTMPVITGVTLKSANVRAKPVVLGMEPRDQLLESIRNFGRDRLRSVS